MKNCLFLLCFIFICRCLLAYSDPEIENLLQSLSDPFQPTLEDYRLIEHYFLNGKRPYLEMMRKKTHIPWLELDFRIQQLRNFKRVGPNGEMPILELHESHVTEGTKDRCIIIYVSYNEYYPDRALRLVDELKECGYRGYIMLRIGGIPDISHGGARLCTIPYTWRINFFKEAVRKGFTKVLYLDTSLHPLTDLSAAFDMMDIYGLFSCSTEFLARDSFIDYFKHVGIPIELRDQIPWLYSYVIGLNFTNEKINQLFHKWDLEMHRLEDFCSMGDDILFTCLAWDFGFRLSFILSETIGAYDFRPSSLPPSFLFYQDNHKYHIRAGWGALYD